MIDERNRNFEQGDHELNRQKKLVDISSITKTYVSLLKKEDVKNVVEGPLLRACETLYDDNIQTFMSSANKGNVASGYAEFSIVFDGLSERNKKVAEQLAAERLADLISQRNVNPSLLNIKIPIKQDSTWGEVEDSSQGIVKRFFKQRFRPVGYTPDWLINRYYAAIEEDITGDHVPPEYFERHGYFYEPISGMFFEGEEARKRALEPVEGEDNSKPAEFSKVVDIERE